jgi:hypothetical protein
MTRRFCLAILLALAVAAPGLLAQDAPASPSPKKNPLLKLAQPWPENDVLAKLKDEAEARALFQDATPIEFTLTSDFKAINKERTPNNGKQFPGVLTIAGKDIPVKLGSRGHLRLKKTVCDFVPIKVDFAAENIAGTIFDGQTSLKLGTHCQNDREFDQFVIREYLTYKLANLATPFSFRARLARVTYADGQSKKPFSTHNALFLEHENDVARRLSGRDIGLPQLAFKALDPDALTTMSILEYMLGNTDYSIWALHNVVIVQNKMRRLFPVPYDFDSSGMVSPPYAAPDTRLPIKKLTDRLYRGPCRTVEEFHAAAEPFRAHKSEMFAALETVKELNGSHKNDMKLFLESFFRAIETPEAIKRTFVDGCHTSRTRV